MCADVYERVFDGVETVARPGLPGRVAAFGRAEPLLASPTDAAFLMAATTKTPRGGRVVLFGHDGFLKSTEGDTPRLIDNAIALAAGETAEPRVAREWPEKLQDVDVLVLPLAKIDTLLKARAVDEHLRRGGGLVTAGTGWGWQQIHAIKLEQATFKQFPGNALLRRYGLCLIDGYTEGGTPFTPTPPHPWSHATAAIEQLDQLEEDDLRVATDSILAAAPFVPDAARRMLGSMLPEPAAAVKAVDPRQRLLGRIALTLELSELAQLKPNAAAAHALAEDFPGVPKGQHYISRRGSFPEERHRFDDRAIPRGPLPPAGLWRTIGYLAAGESSNIRYDRTMVGHYVIQVGAHTDELFHLSKWKRSPRVTQRFELDPSGEMAIATPFGGPLYFVPKDGNEAEFFYVETDRVYLMPTFKLQPSEP
ncbi:MAG: M60 family peptidase N-terminal accessory domain-containing protein, partial [Planctomycetota bacterium]